MYDEEKRLVFDTRDYYERKEWERRNKLTLIWGIVASVVVTVLIFVFIFG